MPTFLQLYRLLLTYKLIKPPKFGNCSVDDLKTPTNTGNTFEDFKRIFQEKNPSESVVQKLRDQLDSLVEHEDWDHKELIAEEYDGTAHTELVDMIIYSTSGYLCRRLLKRTKCDTYLP
jgi:hypothetical protein